MFIGFKGSGLRGLGVTLNPFRTEGFEGFQLRAAGCTCLGLLVAAKGPSSPERPQPLNPKPKNLDPKP